MADSVLHKLIRNNQGLRIALELVTYGSTIVRDTRMMETGLGVGVLEDEECPMKG